MNQYYIQAGRRCYSSTIRISNKLMQSVKKFPVLGIMEEINTVNCFFLGVDCCYNLLSVIKEIGLSYNSIISHFSCKLIEPSFHQTKQFQRRGDDPPRATSARIKAVSNSNAGAIFFECVLDFTSAPSLLYLQLTSPLGDFGPRAELGFW